MLSEELKNVKIQVDEFLKEFFEEKKKGIGKIHPEVKKLIEDIEDVTIRGGDRFRPFMVYLGYLSSINPSIFSVIPVPFSNGVNSGGILKNKIQDSRLRGNDKLPTDLLKLMCSTELLQTFALIHDDIIDRAETRRGGPTIKPDEKAILAGDLCFAFADELLNNFPVAVKKEYDTLREEVIAGEWIDVFYTMFPSVIPAPFFNGVNSSGILKTEDKIPDRASLVRNDKIKGKKNSLHDLLMKIYRYKTVSYTILQPFMMGYAFSVGAMLAVAQGHAQGVPLQKILVDIGLAFQMQDDYLDLFGDARFGKKIGGDLKEGKLTIWHAKIMEADRYRSLSLQKYNKIFGNQTQTLEDVEYIKKIMIDTGVKKQIENEMKNLVSIAKKEIEKLNELNPEAKTLLAEMADFVIDREY